MCSPSGPDRIIGVLMRGENGDQRDVLSDVKKGLEDSTCRKPPEAENS